jgi:hypothetical protein
MSQNIEKIMRKKIETTMIGCLARFEEAFGYLWGQDKEQLTKEEEKFSDIWEQVRESILDHGNHQIQIRVEPTGKRLHPLRHNERYRHCTGAHCYDHP